MPATYGRADLHMHTRHSDGRPTVRAVLDHAARQTKLQVLAITDHDTIEGALEARSLQAQYPFDIVAGEEVTSRDGHILALFITRLVSPGMSAAETVNAIHEQDGLAIAAHPFIAAGTFGKQSLSTQGVGDLIGNVPFDGVEIDNSTPLLRLANFRARRYNRAHGRLAELGNSDAHIVEAIGKSYTRFPGRTMVDLRRAIEQRRTRAHRTSYGIKELLAYGRFWWDSSRTPNQETARAE
ncbi:MAG TPA: PHP-associated domain-containing protein [Chloroflexota bacterium]|nr:PHP-associated domain-containing protein [Chloroflexota bacterium]